MPSSATSNHWEELSRQWEQVGAPLRPGEADLVFYRRAIRELSPDGKPLRALILGVTPELYRLDWPVGSTVLAADRSEVMIRAIWPGPADNARHAKWTELPFENDSCDIVFCDGGLQLIEWPCEHESLAQELARVISPDGRLVVRMFVPPAQPETPEHVLADLFDGQIANLNLLKIRVGMAMAAGSPPSVKLCEVWEALHDAAPDFPALARRLDWPLEHLLAINTYRDRATRYTFVSVAQFAEVFCGSGSFARQRVDFPEYCLGERCPTVTLART